MNDVNIAKISSDIINVIETGNKSILEEYRKEYITVIPKIMGITVILSFDKDGNFKTYRTPDVNISIPEDILSLYNPHSELIESGREFDVECIITISKRELLHNFALMDTLDDSLDFIIGNLTSSDMESIIIHLLTNEYDEYTDIVRLIPFSYTIESSHAKLTPNVYIHSSRLNTELHNISEIHEYINKSQASNISDILFDGFMIIPHSFQKYDRIINIKYKPKTTHKDSTVTNTKLCVGYDGGLFVDVDFEPVEINGDTLSSCVYYLDYKYTNNFKGIAKGDTIRIYDKNSSVVDVVSVKGRETTPRLPITCPVCGHELPYNETGLCTKEIQMRCNNKNCKSNNMYEVHEFFKTLGINSMNRFILNRLYDASLIKKGIPDMHLLLPYFSNENNIEAIHKLTKIDKCKLRTLSKEISHVIDNKMDPAIFLYAIGVGLSLEKLQLILSQITLDELIHFTNDVTSIEFFKSFQGVGETRAFSLCRNMIDKYETVSALRAIFNVDSNSVYTDNYHKKFRIVFNSGLRVDDVQYLDDLIQRCGGYIGTTVAKRANSVLVISTVDLCERAVKSAKKRDVPVVYIDDIEDYIINTMTVFRDI